MGKRHIAVVAGLFLGLGIAAAQSPVAVFKFEDAQAAYAEQRHADALQLLAEAEREFGEVNPPILYLRILVRHALLTSAETLDFHNLERLRADADHYLRVFGAVDALRTQLRSQMREVYRIQQTLGEYPTDRVGYARQLFEQHDLSGVLDTLDPRATDLATNPAARLLRIRALHRIVDANQYADPVMVDVLAGEITGYTPVGADQARLLQQLHANMQGLDDFRAGQRARAAGDQAAARVHFGAAAATGSAPAMAELGVLLRDGLGGPADMAGAREWFERSAQRDSAWGMALLGHLLKGGSGTAPDVDAAFAFMLPAAERGVAFAMYEVGLMYLWGNGVAQDYAAAKAWFERAAALSHADAAEAMGYLYSHGRGVARDDGRARAWYETGARLGSVVAMHNVARIYELGVGAPTNYPAAHTWYERSAAAGYVNAMIDLARVHARGIGTPINYATAVSWYERAAEAGSPLAMMVTDGFYAAGGHGLAANPSRARHWQIKLAEAGGPDAGATPRHASVTMNSGRILPQSWRSRDFAAGGPLRFPDGSDCAGFINAAPDVALDFRPGSKPLGIWASVENVKIAVRAPNGWHCIAKRHGAIHNPVEGRYLVWLSVPSPTDRPVVQLQFAGDCGRGQVAHQPACTTNGI